MAMKGWRRIGIILSVVWFFGFGLYLLVASDANLHEAYLRDAKSCFVAPGLGLTISDPSERQKAIEAEEINVSKKSRRRMTTDDRATPSSPSSGLISGLDCTGLAVHVGLCCPWALGASRLYDPLSGAAAHSMIGKFWDWPEKRVQEHGAALQILLAAKFEVTKFGSRQDDPPDCEGLLDGRWSAVEVTQLMHEKARAQSMKAIKQQPEKPEAYYLWDRDDVLRAIQELIEVKDAKRYKGGPYQRFVLVICTDEFVLNSATMHQFLDGATFRTRVFTDVVVGSSYEPASGMYPTFRLSLVRQSC
jgi:hypothetical protein